MMRFLKRGRQKHGEADSNSNSNSAADVAVVVGGLFSSTVTGMSTSNTSPGDSTGTENPWLDYGVINHNHKWQRMTVGREEAPSNSNSHVLQRCWRSIQCFTARHYNIMRSHKSIPFISLLIFAIICGTGIALCAVFVNQYEDEAEEEAIDLAHETGTWFSDQLNMAILPLYSLTQLATELEIFHDLPAEIQSLPFLPPLDPGGPVTHRNVTGVCDEPALMERFNEIAATIKSNARMDGVLVNLQLAPEAVICLLYPLNNTEDFEDGLFMDNTGARGLDLLMDPKMKYLAEASIVKENVTIVGPVSLRQCIDCHATVEKAFIARLPIQVGDHEIVVNDIPYKRWGFATALINWEQLVLRSGIYETFESRGFNFQLTRTDYKYNDTLDSYHEEMVVLAETQHFYQRARSDKDVTTALQTTNNEWEITVVYPCNSDTIRAWVIAAIILTAFLISVLVYVVLVQKQIHTVMVGKALASNAKVETERNITAYFAHELRNPLGAIDCALNGMPDDLPEVAKELLVSMKLCTGFMSTVMNNLLDVRKLEEGKMNLHSQPLSLKELLGGIYTMLKFSVKPNVDFKMVCNTDGRDWVLGDAHRIQQVYANVVTNAIKNTVSGSITLALSWDGDYLRFDCIDTGQGIPKSEQEKLFERFVQRGGAPGSGLGLVIVKQLVDLMRGSIRFESDPTIRSGTTCTVSLPLEACTQPEVVLVPSKDTQPIEAPLKILITDDIKMNRSMLKRRFQKAIAPNCIIVEATTGEEALQICETERFDVILVDQHMEEGGGVMLGTDVVIALKRMKIDAIIIGSSGNDLAKEFVDAGADWTWRKPIPSNETIILQLRAALPRLDVTTAATDQCDDSSTPVQTDEPTPLHTNQSTLVYSGNDSKEEGIV